MKEPFLIGITGGSCSGKTAIARELSLRLEDHAAAVLSMDSYYIDLSHMPKAERALQNFDHPDAIDFDLLVHDLKCLLAGDGIIVPSYDFTSHTRRHRGAGHTYIVPAPTVKRPVVILEGLHAFYREEIRELEHLRIFIDCSPETCLVRRVERDKKERGRDTDSVRSQWKTTVTPMYRIYVEPVKTFAHIVINGERPVDESVGHILAHERMRILLRND